MAGVGVLAPGAADDDAAGALPPPPIAATALWQDPDSFAELPCRHCSAAAPPGGTPEQLAMKSDRQAAPMAAFSASLGGRAGDAAGGAEDAAGAVGSRGAADFLLGFAVVVLCSGSAAGACAAGGGRPCSADWQPGDKSDAFDRRQSRSSGSLGLIQEQCAMKSLSVQACRTALSWASCEAAALGAGSGAAAGFGAAGSAAAGTGAAAAGAGAAIALTALLQAGVNFA